VIPEHTLTRAPSAELRPNQKDTDTLPPYEVLDPILDAYVEEGRSVEEIVAQGFERGVVEWVGGRGGAQERVQAQASCPRHQSDVEGVRRGTPLSRRRALRPAPAMNAGAIAALRVRVSGRVQGVFFRDSTRREALALGLCGWVRNLPDGSVEAYFVGPREACEKALAFVRVGPPRAHVTGVDLVWEEDAPREAPAAFEIR
jgi:acylphosphatase